MIDFLLINPGNRLSVYQGLGKDLSAIEQPTFSLLVLNYLKKLGYTVGIIDVSASSKTDEEIANLVEEYDPHLVGIYVYGYQPSASTQLMGSAGSIATQIKNTNPNRKIMMSGTHPAALPERTLLEENIDFVSCREGIRGTAQLIDCVKNITQIGDVEDLWYKVDGKAVFTKYGKLFTTEEMNEYLDRPAWEMVDMSVYRSTNWQTFGGLPRQPFASIYTSLGCPYFCSFCCINTPFGNMLSGPRPYRLWSPEVIIKQIDELVNVYNVVNIKIVDEMFVLNVNHVERICDLIIERGYKLNIWAYTRVDSANPKLLSKLKKAGFNWLGMGIENANKFIRDGANKGYADEKLTITLNNIKQEGINIAASFIFGLPDDDLQTMQNTLDLAMYIDIDHANFYNAQAYPGSPLYHEAVKNNWELPNSWIGYSQHSYECFPLNTNNISNVEVLRFRDKAFDIYYSNPDYLKKILNKFGQGTVDEINNMLTHKLKRKLLGD